MESTFQKFIGDHLKHEICMKNDFNFWLCFVFHNRKEKPKEQTELRQLQKRNRLKVLRTSNILTTYLPVFLQPMITMMED